MDASISVFIYLVNYVSMTSVLSIYSVFDYRSLKPNLSRIFSPFSRPKVENLHIRSRWVVVFCLVQTSIHRSKVSRLSARLRIEQCCGVLNHILFTLPFLLNIQFLVLAVYLIFRYLTYIHPVTPILYSLRYSLSLSYSFAP
jgi:hypothetical protein